MNNNGDGYDVGDVATIDATFEQMDDDTGLVAGMDPDNVSFFVVDPAAVETEYEYGTDSEVTRITKRNGIDGIWYRLELPIALGGSYKFRAVSTGDGASCEQGRLYSRDIIR